MEELFLWNSLLAATQLHKVKSRNFLKIMSWSLLHKCEIYNKMSFVSKVTLLSWHTLYSSILIGFLEHVIEVF